MHSLDIIILRNAEAAGRECAHAENDRDGFKARAILALSPMGNEEPAEFELCRGPRKAFNKGRTCGRQEG